MTTSPQDRKGSLRRALDMRLYLTREAVALAVLSGLAVVLFLAVAGLSRVYHAQRESLGSRWFNRGAADLNARQFANAVIEFRTALQYARDNYQYQLSLAEALLGLKQTSEAETYLDNLWERQPENGFVNLELARIAAERGDTEKALRYYHNAIYATWPDDQEAQRRDTRLELIEFLLGNHAKTQAQSELIGLAANLGEDPSQQLRVADLFFRAHDYEHALAMYRSSLKSDRHNMKAMAGAGSAAFELERYSLAERYLQSAVTADSGDGESAARLRITELVLRMDPFRRQLSAVQRSRVVMEAFATAGQRLKFCSGAASISTPAAEDWSKIKRRMTERSLRQDPDLVEAAMDLVFRIESETSATCGSPTRTDQALLLIAKLHEGN